MFFRHFIGYVLGFIGVCGIGFSVLAACGATMTDEGMLIPGIIFVISILILFVGWALRDSAK